MKYQAHSETSYDAAMSMAEDAGTLRQKVHRLLLEESLTDEEIQGRLEMNPSTERPRRIELVERNLVYDAGDRRKTKSGRSAVVWEAVNNQPTTGGSTTMEELRVGPIDRTEMNGLLGRYLEMAKKGHEEAVTLRQRVAKGQSILASPGLTDVDRQFAEGRMKELQEALRTNEWHDLLGLSLSVAHAIAATVNEMAGEAPVPPGSLARVYMPGICNVTVKIDGYGGKPQ